MPREEELPPGTSGQSENHEGIPATLPYFKTVFRILAVFTAASLLVPVALVSAGSFSSGCTETLTFPQEIKDLLSLCAFTWKVGFVAVVTLTAGKALDILKVLKSIG
jgi:hypothetical protein